jgi:hypothetical protein
MSKIITTKQLLIKKARWVKNKNKTSIITSFEEGLEVIYVDSERKTIAELQYMGCKWSDDKMESWNEFFIVEEPGNMLSIEKCQSCEKGHACPEPKRCMENDYFYYVIKKKRIPIKTIKNFSYEAVSIGKNGIGLKMKNVEFEKEDGLTTEPQT